MLQLNKPLVLIIGLLSVGALGYNIYTDPQVSHLFGKEINNWIYRGFWFLVILVSAYNYYNIDRNTLKNKSKKKYKQ